MAGAAVAAVVGSAVGEAVATAVIFDIAAATTLDWVATYAVIQAGTSMVASSLVRSALGGNDAPDLPQSSQLTSQRAQGVLVNSAGNIEPIPVVYGFRKLGGIRALLDVSSTRSTKTGAETYLLSGGSPSCTVAHAADFTADVGVRWASTVSTDENGDPVETPGAALVKVTGTPTAGQYAVVAGVYTFAAADVGKSARITYSYSQSSGNNRFLNTAIVFSEGPVAGIDAVYADDLISTDAKVTGALLLERFLGADDQAASDLLIAELPGEWTTDHRGCGLAYLAARCAYSQSAFPGGAPTFTADLRGRTLYDPRDSQTRFSNNFALVVRDYLTNSRYGRGIPTAMLDEASFIAAANTCDERVAVPNKTWSVTANATANTILLPAADWLVQTGDGIRFSTTGGLPGGLVAGVTYYAIRVSATALRVASSVANAMSLTAIDLTSAGSGTHTLTHWDEARYAINGVVDTDQTLYDNTLKLLSAGRGMLIYSGGKYRLKIDKAEDTTGAFEFTEDNITGAWEIRQPGRRERVNRVVANFFNPAKNWQPDPAISDSATDRAADGGLVLEAKIDLPFTSSTYTAQRIAQLERKQSRYGLGARFTAFQEGLRCEVGDVVKVTHSLPGWNQKLFRVQRLEIKDDDEVVVEVREYNAAVYSQDALTTAPTPEAGRLGDPLALDAPTGLSLSSGQSTILVAGDGTVVSRILAQWTAVPDAWVVGYEVEFKKSADSTWLPAPFVANAAACYLAPVEDGLGYDVRVRSLSSLGVRSAWSQVLGHNAAGKGVPPSDVAGLTVQQSGAAVLFTWPQVADSDLSGYEIRFNPQGLTAWDDATPLTRVTKGTQITTIKAPPGAWTFLIKARDTTGLYSANAAAKDFEVESDYIVVAGREERDYWETGTLTNFVIHGPTRALVPKSQSTAQAAGWSTFDQAVPAAFSTCTYEAPEVDTGADGRVRAYGIPISSLMPGAAGLADPEVQVDTRTAAGAYDGFAPWAIGFVQARYFKFRLQLTTGDGLAKVASFAKAIDGEPRAERFVNVSVPVAGLTIPFGSPYYYQPTVTATPVGGTATSAKVTAQSTTAATVILYNGTTAVAGNANVEATGV